MKTGNIVILMAAALIICGAANLYASDGSDHIKYSSDYASLQEAVDSTRVGDILYIDRDYTLTDTLRIKKGDITIIGTKSVIQPDSNGYPSPLVQVNNNGDYPIINNLSIRNLRLVNQRAAAGYGTGTGLEIFWSRVGSSANVSAVKLEDLYIENFNQAIDIKNAFNIFIKNCMANENYTGLTVENTPGVGGAGQIKVHGGYFTNNSRHIYLPGTGVKLINWSCAHARSGYMQTAIGIFNDSTGGGVEAIGCHFEDLSIGISFPTGWSSFVNAIANEFVDISDKAIYVQTQINSFAAIGNSLDNETKALFDVPRVQEGLLIGGNDNSINNLVDSTAGLREQFRWIGGSTVPAFRIPYMTGNRLPAASWFRRGSMIFVSDSSKVKISNGTDWINLN